MAAGAGRVSGPLLAGALLTAFGFRTAWLLAFAMVALYWSWAWLHLNHATTELHDAQ